MKLTATVILKESETTIENAKVIDYKVKSRLAQQIANTMTDSDRLIEIKKEQKSMSMADPISRIQYTTNVYVITDQQRDSIRQDFEIIIKNHPKLESSLNHILNNQIGR